MTSSTSNSTGGAPPTRRAFWFRNAAAIGVFFVAVVAVQQLWRITGWPGAAFANACTFGFGVVLGSRYGASGRIRGPGLWVIVLTGAVASVVFYFLSATSAIQP